MFNCKNVKQIKKKFIIQVIFTPIQQKTRNKKRKLCIQHRVYILLMGTKATIRVFIRISKNDTNVFDKKGDFISLIEKKSQTSLICSLPIFLGHF